MVGAIDSRQQKTNAHARSCISYDGRFSIIGMSAARIAIQIIANRRYGVALAGLRPVEVLELRFCFGASNALRGTMVPSGRNRALFAAPV